VWSQSDRHSIDVEIDTGFLNMAMFSEFVLETLPQLVLQIVNGLFTQSLSLFAKISIGMSAAVALNGVYRYGYWAIYMRKPLEDIPLGFQIKLAKAIKRSFNVEVASVNPIVQMNFCENCWSIVVSAITDYAKVGDLKSNAKLCEIVKVVGVNGAKDFINLPRSQFERILKRMQPEHSQALKELLKTRFEE
jgi:hypothetical protein